ncbi:hypothetical protein Syun_026061 [Stephania yunnanensis]|uniref:Uncharacterized protein n=1 Tax=Stephania yunnanensis TaxID=152371 RepID=A0AAP0HWC4_9MAGN
MFSLPLFVSTFRRVECPPHRRHSSSSLPVSPPLPNPSHFPSAPTIAITVTFHSANCCCVQDRFDCRLVPLVPPPPPPHTSQASITVSPTTTSSFPVGFDHRLLPTRRRLLSVVAASYHTNCFASIVHCRYRYVHRLFLPVPPPPPPHTSNTSKASSPATTSPFPVGSNHHQSSSPPTVRTTAAPTAGSTTASNSIAASHYLLPPVPPPSSPRISHASITVSPTTTSQER